MVLVLLISNLGSCLQGQWISLCLSLQGVLCLLYVLSAAAEKSCCPDIRQKGPSRCEVIKRIKGVYRHREYDAVVEPKG